MPVDKVTLLRRFDGHQVEAVAPAERPSGVPVHLAAGTARRLGILPAEVVGVAPERSQTI